MLALIFPNNFFVSKQNHNISPEKYNLMSNSNSEWNLNIPRTQNENFEEDTFLNSKESKNNKEKQSFKVENKKIENKLKSKELSFYLERQELIAQLLTKGEKTHKNEKLSEWEKRKNSYLKQKNC